MCEDSDVDTTSFPGSLILPPPGASEEAGGGKLRDPGNEVDVDNEPKNYQYPFPPLCLHHIPVMDLYTV